MNARDEVRLLLSLLSCESLALAPALTAEKCDGASISFVLVKIHAESIIQNKVNT